MCILLYNLVGQELSYIIPIAGFKCKNILKTERRGAYDVCDMHIRGTPVTSFKLSNMAICYLVFL